MVELLHRLRETAPDVYDALLLVKQPTERDLTAHRFDMRELAALKLTIIDESLTSLADLEPALELGWSGVALKACKCQSIELLIAAWADVHGIDITVQDLTCPGIALLQSVGLTARLNSMMNAVGGQCATVLPGNFTPGDGDSWQYDAGARWCSSYWFAARAGVWVSAREDWAGDFSIGPLAEVYGFYENAKVPYEHFMEKAAIRMTVDYFA